MNKKPFVMDERQRGVLRDFISVLYFITIASLIGIQLYRQFVLGQATEEWNDIALLITFNVLFLFGGGLYLSGTFNLKRIKARYIVTGYVVFVVIGLLFTIFKYAVLLGQEVGLEQVWDYILIILPITVVLSLGWGLVGYLGHRRMEKQLE